MIGKRHTHPSLDICRLFPHPSSLVGLTKDQVVERVLLCEETTAEHRRCVCAMLGIEYEPFRTKGRRELYRVLHAETRIVPWHTPTQDPVYILT